MKLTYGLFSFLLACLAVILYGLGDLERTSAFVEKYENTAAEERAAVAAAFHQSWGVDKWTIASGTSLCAAIAFGIATFKQPKNRPSKTE
jgi:hypothetical protein